MNCVLVTEQFWVTIPGVGQDRAHAKKFGHVSALVPADRLTPQEMRALQCVHNRKYIYTASNDEVPDATVEYVRSFTKHKACHAYPSLLPVGTVEGCAIVRAVRIDYVL